MSGECGVAAGVSCAGGAVHSVEAFRRDLQDGFVFRVDMRLRPFGQSGPLVISLGALEDYLQAHGRDWERYAWIKARAITGAAAYADTYRNCVRPFVYRRYLDFGVFESLRDMKALIAREVSRRDLAQHLKLGTGGIREIEFIAQSFQLVRVTHVLTTRPAQTSVSRKTKITIVLPSAVMGGSSESVECDCVRVTCRSGGGPFRRRAPVGRP